MVDLNTNEPVSLEQLEDQFEQGQLSEVEYAKAVETWLVQHEQWDDLKGYFDLLLHSKGDLSFSELVAQIQNKLLDLMPNLDPDHAEKLAKYYAARMEHFDDINLVLHHHDIVDIDPLHPELPVLQKSVEVAKEEDELIVGHKGKVLVEAEPIHDTLLDQTLLNLSDLSVKLLTQQEGVLSVQGYAGTDVLDTLILDISETTLLKTDGLLDHFIVKISADNSTANFQTKNQITLKTPGDLANLAEGQATGDTVSVTFISKLSGESKTEVLKLNVIGTNQDPIINLEKIIADSPTFIETGTASFDLSEAISDINLSDLHTVKAVFGEPDDANYGTLSVEGKIISFTVADQMQYLGEGMHLEIPIVLTVEDGHGGVATEVVWVDVLGENDAPQITLSVKNFDVDADATTKTIDLSDFAYDVDLDDKLTFQAKLKSTDQGSVRIDSNDPTKLVFEPGEAFKQLAFGEKTTVEIDVTAVDSHGAQATQTISLVVHGTYDAPVLMDDSFDLMANQTAQFDVLANDYVIDNGSKLTLVGVSSGFAAVDNAFSIVNNKVLFNPNAYFAAMPEGEQSLIGLTYYVQDESGKIHEGHFDVTVAGFNDAPIANDDFVQVTTGDEMGVAFLPMSNDSDPDTGDTIQFVKFLDLENTRGQVEAERDAEGNLTGKFFYIAKHGFDDLNYGEKVTETVHYEITDSHGAVTQASIDVLITGGVYSELTQQVDSYDVIDSSQQPTISAPVMATSSGTGVVQTMLLFSKPLGAPNNLYYEVDSSGKISFHYIGYEGGFTHTPTSDETKTYYFSGQGSAGETLKFTIPAGSTTQQIFQIVDSSVHTWNEAISYVDTPLPLNVTPDTLVLESNSFLKSIEIEHVRLSDMTAKVEGDDLIFYIYTTKYVNNHIATVNVPTLVIKDYLNNTAFQEGLHIQTTDHNDQPGLELIVDGQTNIDNLNNYFSDTYFAFKDTAGFQLSQDNADIHLEGTSDLYYASGKHMTIDAGGGDDNLFITGSDNDIRAGDGDDVVRLSGNHNTLDLGAGYNELISTGEDNIVHVNAADQGIVHIKSASLSLHQDTLVLEGFMSGTHFDISHFVVSERGGDLVLSYKDDYGLIKSQIVIEDYQSNIAISTIRVLADGQTALEDIAISQTSTLQEVQQAFENLPEFQNEAPVAQDDMIVAKQGGEPVVFDPLINDTDSNSGQTLAFVKFLNLEELHGNIAPELDESGNWTGKFVYTSDQFAQGLDFSQGEIVDTIRYQMQDSMGATSEASIEVHLVPPDLLESTVTTQVSSSFRYVEMPIWMGINTTSSQTWYDSNGVKFSETFIKPLYDLPDQVGKVYYEITNNYSNSISVTTELNFHYLGMGSGVSGVDGSVNGQHIDVAKLFFQGLGDGGSNLTLSLSTGTMTRTDLERILNQAGIVSKQSLLTTAEPYLGNTSGQTKLIAVDQSIDSLKIDLNNAKLDSMMFKQIDANSAGGQYNALFGYPKVGDVVIYQLRIDDDGFQVYAPMAIIKDFDNNVSVQSGLDIEFTHDGEGSILPGSHLVLTPEVNLDDLNHYLEGVSTGHDNGTVELSTGDDAYYAVGDHVTINANDGNDQINAKLTDSFVRAGAGDDEINVVGNGNDIRSGEGHDKVFVNGEDNFVLTGDGNDLIVVGGQHNYIDAGAGLNEIISNGHENLIHFDLMSHGITHITAADGAAHNDTLQLEGFMDNGLFDSEHFSVTAQDGNLLLTHKNDGGLVDGQVIVDNFASNNAIQNIQILSEDGASVSHEITLGDNLTLDDVQQAFANLPH